MSNFDRNGTLGFKTMSKNAEYKTVEEYFESQPELTKEALEGLRTCILKASPTAKETLNYNIPAYQLVEGGKRDQQIMIAGYKNHVGLYPHPSVMEKFDHEIKEFKKGKGSVQFPLNLPLPEDLIIRMVKYRMKLLGIKK
jgi:uncharacterized protein YdhG (YjbR/CyaY superfamily)